jgi:proline racemase
MREFIDRLTAVDVHAEGEPGRVITAGVPDLPGATMLEKMQWMEANVDDIRLRMLREPNGYPGLCCNVIVPPTDPAADAGFIIMEQTEYPPMSGSNTICVTTALLETGIVPMVEPVTELVLESPAGLIGVRADCADGKVTRVNFRNVPAFVLHLDVSVDVPTLGEISVDIAWGGMFYAIADADALGVSLDASNGAEIARVSEMIRVATREQMPVQHPIHPELTGPTISQLSGAPSVPGAHRRNAVTVATGELDWDRPETWGGALDRCPCGTGTSAKMAVLHARGELGVGDEFVHEGPLGTTFTGRILEETRVAGIPAVVPEIGGQGWITGFAEYVLDPTDPFPAGFTIGDIWP